MLFSSFVFLFLFLPCVIFSYYVIFRRSRLLQNLLLLVASLLFYAWGEPKFVFIMLLSILANWLFGLFVNKFRESKKISRLIIAFSAIFNVGIMFIFKYLMFTLENVNSIFGLSISVPSIALPIGISFFTFQAFSYVIDVYRGKGAVQKNPFYVGLYISFFPQLIAGPIVRYQTIADQITGRKETLDDFSKGVTRFIVGFTKKILIANIMAVIADAAFNSTDEISVAFAWLGAIAYTFQIYFDFSGYSDMAIGLGRMFGFHFLENFNYPYISKSISEFWRRWHISLGSWFRDYVYFPLGGSRVKTNSRLIFNLFVVWFLTGVWHGANWTFIVWGLIYFALISFEKLSGFEKKWQKHSFLKHLYTMFFVVFGWVLFRSESIGLAGDYLSSMLGIVGNPLVDNAFLMHFTNNIVIFVAATLFSLPIAKYMREKFADKHKTLNVLYVVGIVVLFIVAVSYMVKGSYNPFIYFNF
ncbi:MAG TPA: MBOAT family O-acyltransferase [Clostridia bacterium]|nr:MBOAT family O-acyltransferase [Clostridia bacterium]